MWHCYRQITSHRILCLSCKAHRFCFFSSSGNTPLHLAVMMGHKGKYYFKNHLHVAYVCLSVAFLNESLRGHICLLVCFSIYFCVCLCVLACWPRLCVCICLATRHLSQLTTQIPEGKILMHDQKGCVYGFLPGKKGASKKTNLFCYYGHIFSYI